MYVERQRREHAIKLQSFPEYDVPLWFFMNVNEIFGRALKNDDVSFYEE